MQQRRLTSVYRTQALAFVSSVLLLLLLAWQLSFKATAVDKTYVAVNQAMVDITELGIDFNDFEHAIPVTIFQFGEFNGWLEITTVQLFTPFSSIFIPQSRAPPTLL